MKLLSFIIMLLPLSIYAQTEIEGEVSGEWTAEDSPYIVIDSTWIPEDEELRIGPGVDVLFGEGLGIDVLGSIITEGTEDDSVRILPREEDETWRGLHLTGTWPWNENHLTFSAIRGADNALLSGGNVRIYINNCSIQSVYIPIGEFPRDDGGKRIEIANSVILGGFNVVLTRSGLFAENTIFSGGISNSYGTTSLDSCIVYGSCPGSDMCTTIYRNSRFLLPNDSPWVRVYVSGTMTDCYVEGSVYTGITGRTSIIEDNYIDGRLSVERCSARIINNTVGEDIRIFQCDSVDVDDCFIQGSLIIGYGDYVKAKNVTAFNALHDNTDALGVYSDDDYVSNFFIERCTFYGRIKIRWLFGRAEIVNNTIVKNNDLIREIFYFQFVTMPVVIRNNIIVTNDEEIALLKFDHAEHIEALEFKFNCIWGTDYIVEGNRYDFELDESNILENPQLVSLDSLDFHLTEDSPCIDSGDPDSPLDPDSTRADMGRFYFHHENAVLDFTAPICNDFELFSAYPNPFNSNLNIDFFNPVSSPITVVLYDIDGRELIKEDEQWYNIGRHSFALDGRSLPSGSYFVSLKSDKFVRYQRIELVR
ncbi:MAG: T9SS type A sorting domain-containing protein [Calditrichaeota bacterium]|nr:T9SS type A sorting domain-containing protein [Calditrichota bacterium]